MDGSDLQTAVESLVEALMLEDDGTNPASTEPIERQQERQRLKYRERLELREYKAKLTLAIETVTSEHIPCMPEEEGARILKELGQLGSRMRELSDEEATRMSPALLGVSEETVVAILQIAQKHYTDEHFRRASALFTLLTTIDSLEPHYWICLGCSEQEAADYQAAINAYQMAAHLAPHRKGFPSPPVRSCLFYCISRYS